ncbi:MAG: DUF2156 domain-containing protein [Clostridia bacterium]|nr:DUF2156 domain-containing protein [Clostridia bacterium]
MTHFRPIELNDKPWMDACRDVRRNPFSSLSFPCLYAWKNTYGFSITGDEDFFVVYSQHDRAYYCPCGKQEKCMAFIEQTCREEKKPHFLYLTREQGEHLKQCGFHLILRDDLSEYISSSSALALTEGHHMSNSFKMKVRHFQRDVPYTVCPLTEAELPFLRDLARIAEAESRGIMGDWNVLETELESFHALGMWGIGLETADGRRAFLLGYENTAEEFTMTMTKHAPSLPIQVTAVLVHEMACRLKDKYALINLEEDLGLSGLRRAKMLYSPVDRLNVYEAIR